MNEFRAIKNGEQVGFGTPLEDVLGFSRAIRAGDTIYTSGMTATDMRGEVIEGGIYEQLMMIYAKIDMVLKAHGSGLKDVVKEVWYARNFDHMEDVGRAHKDAFGDTRPAITGIKAELLDPKMLIEIDAIAVIRREGNDPNLHRVVGA